VIALGLGYWYGLPGEGSGQENAGKPEDKEETAAKEPEFLKQGLVAYYPFNGNAKDESDNSHHGEVNKAILAVDRHGNPDSAYETKMDGGNILLPNEPVFDLQKHTICGWFRLRQTSTHPMLISKQKPFEGVAFSLCGWHETKINDRAYALHSDKAKTELIAKNTITSNLREWNFFAGTSTAK